MYPHCFRELEHLVVFFSAGPSFSKHCLLKELVGGQNVNCSSKYNTKFTGIFAEKMQKLFTFFQQKYFSGERMCTILVNRLED